MESTNSCANCNEVIKSLQFMHCQDCNSVFHLSCTSLSLAHMRVVQDVPNLFWSCDNCVELKKNPQLLAAHSALGAAFRELTEVHKTALEDVRNEVRQNTESVLTLTSRLATSAPPGTPAWPSNNKRRANQMQVSPEQTAKPKLPKATVGKKVMPGTGHNVAVITKPQESVDLFWLWLASFPTTVTEDDIRRMAKECLECGDSDRIEVKMLVKDDHKANLSTLRSITFKIGVETAYREMCLDCDTWPAGVAFREFVDYGRAPSVETISPGPHKAPRKE